MVAPGRPSFPRRAAARLLALLRPSGERERLRAAVDVVVLELAVNEKVAEQLARRGAAAETAINSLRTAGWEEYRDDLRAAVRDDEPSLWDTLRTLYDELQAARGAEAPPPDPDRLREARRRLARRRP